MNRYGVSKIHNAIKDKLIDYIKAQYLSENQLLIEACEEDINKKGFLYQEPFIEANPAYEVVDDGIIKANIPNDAKKVLMEMCDNKL